jgi:hypothetical protein
MAKILSNLSAKNRETRPTPQPSSRQRPRGIETSERCANESIIDATCKPVR